MAMTIREFEDWLESGRLPREPDDAARSYLPMI